MAYRHVVLFRVHDAVDDVDIDRAIASIRAVLDARQGVVSSYVTRSLDRGKGTVIVEDVTFADWLVGDYHDH